MPAGAPTTFGPSGSQQFGPSLAQPDSDQHQKGEKRKGDGSRGTAPATTPASPMPDPTEPAERRAQGKAPAITCAAPEVSTGPLQPIQEDESPVATSVAPNDEEDERLPLAERKKKALEEMLEAVKEQGRKEYMLARTRGRAEDQYRQMYSAKVEWQALQGDVVVQEREVQEVIQRVADKKRRFEEITAHEAWL